MEQIRRDNSKKITLLKKEGLHEKKGKKVQSDPYQNSQTLIAMLLAITQ